MTRREKNTAIKALKEVHAAKCPLERLKDDTTFNCGCAIGLVYRLLAGMEVEATK